MSTIYRTVFWVLQSDLDASLEHLLDAVGQTDFRIVDRQGGKIVIDVPPVWYWNRRRARLTGEISAVHRGTRIKWTMESSGKRQYQHLATIAANLPEGLLFDHGIGAVSGHLAKEFFSGPEMRHLSNVLGADEMVHAIGVGYRSSRLGIVAITDERMIFLEKNFWSEDIAYFYLDAIGALSLTSTPRGESLTVTHDGMNASITGLGHGQGQKISRKLRELNNARTRSSGRLSADWIADLERLAELKSQGYLGEDEFEQQKAGILAKL
jgi:hypothetical protein